MSRMVFRLVGQIILSALLMIPATSVTLLVIDVVSRDISVLRSFLRNVVSLSGDTPPFVGLCFIYFILLMIVLNWRRFRSFSKLGYTVQHIAEGNLDVKINIPERNEVGELAADLNQILAQLKQSLEDERLAEQSKNELVTNVSHDLRTPLTSILGYLALVDEDRYRDEVELRHYVQIAYAKSQRLHVLIQDLFEFTRLRHDAIPLLRKPVNTVEMMSQMLMHYRLPLRKVGMSGHLITSETDLTITGDADKLFRVFDNLFSNAMVYGQEGHKLDTVVRRDGVWAVIEVVNYGSAIPSIDLPHLFERFYRVDRSRNEHTGGSGLGLAISKSIVERHGGNIHAESDQNRTSFIVRLPISSSASGT
ncbi:MAG: vanS [Paenibacillus sp.]|nr:vanS [Paenibacillus sp.]